MAITILGIILLTVYGTLSRAIYAKDHSEASAELNADGRETVLRMADEIEGAMSPAHAGDAIFQGVSGGASQFTDQVRFAIVRRPPFGLLGGAGGRVVVTYSLDATERPNVFLLRRDEVPIASAGSGDTSDAENPEGLQNSGDTQNDPGATGTDNGPQPFSVPVIDNVAGLRFRYLDGVSGQWVNEWDSTGENGDDFTDRIPLAVDIALYLYDENGQPQEFATLVDLPLAVKPTPNR